MTDIGKELKAAWHPVRTMPTDREVKILSVKGIVCKAKISPVSGTRWIRRRDKWGPERIRCRRITEAGNSGDIWAIAWREK